MIRPRPIATGRTQSSGSPAAVNGPSTSSAMAGSARKPIARLVTVMPTWAPDSWVESDRRAVCTPAAPASPLLDRAVDAVAVHGDEGELRGDEDAARHDEQQRDDEQDRGGHRAVTLPRVRVTADFGGPYPRGADSPRVDPPPPVPPPVRSLSMPSPHPVPRAGRRGVLAAGAAAGAAPLLLGADPAAAAGGYRPVSYDKIPLLSRPGAAPGQPVLLRDHPGARGRGAPPGGRREVVRLAARPGRHPRQRRAEARAVVALPVLRTAAPLAGQHQGRQGRLGGHGRLPALGDDAADALAATAPGGDGAVLGVAPARPDQRRPQLPLPQAVRRRHLPARARSLRPAARGDGHPPGDARLPRPGRLDQAAPQREPRARAPRDPHGRRRRDVRG